MHLYSVLDFCNMINHELTKTVDFSEKKLPPH